MQKYDFGRAAENMTSGGKEKKRVSFMAIDMTKSTGLLVDSNEVAWLSTLLSSFSDFERLITSHRGRVLKFDGDSFLGVFDDIDDAIRAAVQIQKDLAGRTDAEKLPPFRIALHSDRVYPLYAVKGTVDEASLNTPIDYVGLGVVSVYRMLEWINPRGIIISEKATSNAKLGDLTEDLPLSGKQGLGPEQEIALTGIPGGMNCHELMYTEAGFGFTPPSEGASQKRYDDANPTTFVGKIDTLGMSSFKIRQQTQLGTTPEDRIFEVSKDSVIGGGNLRVGGQVIFAVPLGDPGTAIEVVTVDTELDGLVVTTPMSAAFIKMTGDQFSGRHDQLYCRLGANSRPLTAGDEVRIRVKVNWDRNRSRWQGQCDLISA